MATKDYSLSFSNVAASRGEQVLMDGVSFTLSSKKLIWVQGPNGTGKTTLLRIAAGLLSPSSGSVSWRLNREPCEPTDLITYQAHMDALDPEYTVLETLLFWKDIFETSKNISHVIDVMGLSQQSNLRTRNLSAGQKRRLILGRVALADAPIWIMDETLAAVDQAGQTLFENMLQAHINNGGAALLASHTPAFKVGKDTSILKIGGNNG